ncbi:uncharacterized protein LOC127120051 [Lathyrus oleraceus]|uniref:uncharacterized protein LOC127120051 n=1 Tax=Pisum sativum TaxID=3888 RepID=UPI0021D079F8|nr:uncharacterized protein LOC127120051 [Pisum sativum]
MNEVCCGMVSNLAEVMNWSLIMILQNCRCEVREAEEGGAVKLLSEKKKKTPRFTVNRLYIGLEVDVNFVLRSWYCWVLALSFGAASLLAWMRFDHLCFLFLVVLDCAHVCRLCRLLDSAFSSYLRLACWRECCFGLSRFLS